MEIPITLGLLMHMFNLLASITAITVTFALESMWYWKALWIFFLINSIAGIAIRFL